MKIRYILTNYLLVFLKLAVARNYNQCVNLENLFESSQFFNQKIDLPQEPRLWQINTNPFQINLRSPQQNTQLPLIQPQNTCQTSFNSPTCCNNQILEIFNTQATSSVKSKIQQYFNSYLYQLTSIQNNLKSFIQSEIDLSLANSITILDKKSGKIGNGEILSQVYNFYQIWQKIDIHKIDLKEIKIQHRQAEAPEPATPGKFRIQPKNSDILYEKIYQQFEKILTIIFENGLDEFLMDRIPVDETHPQHQCIMNEISSAKETRNRKVNEVLDRVSEKISTPIKKFLAIETSIKFMIEILELISSEAINSKCIQKYIQMEYCQACQPTFNPLLPNCQNTCQATFESCFQSSIKHHQLLEKYEKLKNFLFNTSEKLDQNGRNNGIFLDFRESLQYFEDKLSFEKRKSQKIGAKLVNAIIDNCGLKQITLSEKEIAKSREVRSSTLDGPAEDLYDEDPKNYLWSRFKKPEQPENLEQQIYHPAYAYDPNGSYYYDEEYDSDNYQGLQFDDSYVYRDADLEFENLQQNVESAINYETDYDGDDIGHYGEEYYNVDQFETYSVDYIPEIETVKIETQTSKTSQSTSSSSETQPEGLYSFLQKIEKFKNTEYFFQNIESKICSNYVETSNSKCWDGQQVRTKFLPVEKTAMTSKPSYVKNPVLDAYLAKLKKKFQNIEEILQMGSIFTHSEYLEHFMTDDEEIDLIEFESSGDGSNDDFKSTISFDDQDYESPELLDLRLICQNLDATIFDDEDILKKCESYNRKKVILQNRVDLDGTDYKITVIKSQRKEVNENSKVNSSSSLVSFNFTIWMILVVFLNYL